jgi:hypothetical protein
MPSIRSCSSGRMGGKIPGIARPARNAFDQRFVPVIAGRYQDDMHRICSNLQILFLFRIGCALPKTGGADVYGGDTGRAAQLPDPVVRTDAARARRGFCRAPLPSTGRVSASPPKRLQPGSRTPGTAHRSICSGNMASRWTPIEDTRHTPRSPLWKARRAVRTEVAEGDSLTNSRVCFRRV